MARPMHDEQASLLRRHVLLGSHHPDTTPDVTERMTVQNRFPRTLAAACRPPSPAARPRRPSKKWITYPDMC